MVLNSHSILAFSTDRTSTVSLSRSSLGVRPTVAHVGHVGRCLSTRRSTVALRQSKEKSNPSLSNDSKTTFLSRLGEEDEYFDGQTTFSLVATQSLLVVIAVGVAALVKTPNFGLGPGVAFDLKSVGYGTLMTLPLGVLAWALDLIEERVPALKDVTIATQRSVLALMGSTFKPKLGLFVAILLGTAAGLGEEMLFRGVLQFELIGRIGIVTGVGLSSVVFGLLHAVTPLYAFLATLASVYFGYLYLDTGNLAVPIVTHAFYDVFALMYAHWCVANLSPKEQKALAEWDGPGSA